MSPKHIAVQRDCPVLLKCQPRIEDKMFFNCNDACL